MNDDLILLNGMNIEWWCLHSLWGTICNYYREIRCLSLPSDTESLFGQGK